jgi:hypothetical protein
MGTTTLALPNCEELPIPITLDWFELSTMATEHTSPDGFNQKLLEKLKAAGGPVEGIINLRLSHGKLARVKPDLHDQKLGRFRYLWLPPQHCAMVEQATKQDQAMAAWRNKREAGTIQ